MTNTTAGFALDTLLRKKIEKRRRKEKDVRIHNRLSALLWLGQGRTPEQVAELLGVCPPHCPQLAATLPTRRTPDALHPGVSRRPRLTQTVATRPSQA